MTTITTEDLRAQIATGQLPVSCPKCGVDIDPILSKVGLQIKAECPRHGYLKFLRQRHNSGGYIDVILNMAGKLNLRDREKLCYKIMKLQ
jgi:hypothetical protein